MKIILNWKAVVKVASFTVRNKRFSGEFGRDKKREKGLLMFEFTLLLRSVKVKKVRDIHGIIIGS